IRRSDSALWHGLARPDPSTSTAAPGRAAISRNSSITSLKRNGIEGCRNGLPPNTAVGGGTAGARSAAPRGQENSPTSAKQISQRSRDTEPAAPHSGQSATRSSVINGASSPGVRAEVETRGGFVATPAP